MVVEYNSYLNEVAGNNTSWATVSHNEKAILIDCFCRQKHSVKVSLSSSDYDKIINPMNASHTFTNSIMDQIIRDFDAARFKIEKGGKTLKEIFPSLKHWMKIRISHISPERWSSDSIQGTVVIKTDKIVGIDIDGGGYFCEMPEFYGDPIVEILEEENTVKLNSGETIPKRFKICDAKKYIRIGMKIKIDIQYLREFFNSHNLPFIGVVEEIGDDSFRVRSLLGQRKNHVINYGNPCSDLIIEVF